MTDISESETQDKSVEARRAEIERRYDRQKPERTLRLNRIAVVRVRDVERYLECRYGRVLPDDDAGREDLVILLNHLAQNPVNPQGKMLASIHCWASWMNHDERQELVERIAEKPRWYKAKTLGRLMRLTEEERARWGIDSIWAFTWTDADVRERDRATRRQRKQTTRRRQGAVPREEYEATSKSRTEPWKALNMSRPTYYRKLKAGEIPNETSVSPLYRDSYRGPTPVSSVSAPIILPPEPIEKRRAPKARRRVPVFDGVGLTPPPKSRRQQPGRTIQ